MAKAHNFFVCQNCGNEFSKWAGRCSQCGEWNSLVETLRQVKGKFSGKRKQVVAAKPVKLSEVGGYERERIPTGIGELDRVLGGGIVPGSVVLVAGEPGIGKSTLLTQLALRVTSTPGQSSTASPGVPNSMLYVCGEESPAQIKLRVERLKGDTQPDKDQLLFFLPETDVDVVVASIEKEKPGVVIVDSIQTMYTADLSSATGSVSQVSESTNRLLDLAKKLGVPIFLVGHVTKGGAIAGPKVLEHTVDAVLEITGDRQHEFRLLRATKNRFGATDEVGIFSMDEAGLAEVANPSDRFLSDRQKGVPGSAVVCVLEGTRPVLVEIQALVVPSQLVVPRRVASGVDQRRVQLLTAVLTKRCGLRLGNMDVYVNVAGGLSIREPASDFGIALAIASSIKNKALTGNTVVIGEVGLLGEIRKVGRMKQRISEAKAQGFNKFLTASEFSSLTRAIQEALK